MIWGGAKRMGGGKRTRERAVPKNSGPLQGASGLLGRGIFVQENRATTPEGGGKRTVRGGSKTPFWEGCHSWGFPPPSFFHPPMASSEEKHLPYKQETHKQKFTGLSQDYPGTVPAFSWDFPGILLKLCLFPCFPRKRQYINKFDPHSRDHAETLFMFIGFFPLLMYIACRKWPLSALFSILKGFLPGGDFLRWPWMTLRAGWAWPCWAQSAFTLHLRSRCRRRWPRTQHCISIIDNRREQQKNT